MIDRKIREVLSFICCMKRNGNGVIALYANIVKDMIQNGLGDIKQLTIGEVLALKAMFELTNSEATTVFLGGINCENVQV